MHGLCLLARLHLTLVVVVVALWCPHLLKPRQQVGAAICPVFSFRCVVCAVSSAVSSFKCVACDVRRAACDARRVARGA